MYQVKKSDYEQVENYFSLHFPPPILTAGAVSAEDFQTNHTADDNGLRELVENEDFDVYVPADYMGSTSYGKDIVSVEKMPADACGNISISVDDFERYNQKVVSGPNGISLGDLNLDYGNHSIKIAYSGDNKYRDFIKNTTAQRVYIDVECPEEYCIDGGEVSLGIRLDDKITGYVRILIDNEKVYDKLYSSKKSSKHFPEQICQISHL